MLYSTAAHRDDINDWQVSPVLYCICIGANQDSDIQQINVFRYFWNGENNEARNWFSARTQNTRMCHWIIYARIVPTEKQQQFRNKKRDKVAKTASPIDAAGYRKSGAQLY